MSGQAQTVVRNSGINLAGGMLLLFIALRLTHTIDWSWWWVLAPAWAPVALVLAFAVLAGLAGGAAAGVRTWARRRKVLAAVRAAKAAQGGRP